MGLSSSTLISVLVVSLTLQLIAGMAEENRHGVEVREKAAKFTGNMEDCPRGWRRSGNKCFVLTKERKTFRGARGLCEIEYNATLPTVFGEHENEAVTNITKLHSTFSSPIWLYLVYNHEYKVARWLDGSQFDYVHWDDGQPSDEYSCEVHYTIMTRGHVCMNSSRVREMECVSLASDGNWATKVVCSASLPVVCEKRLPTMSEPNSKPNGIGSPQLKRQKIPAISGHELDSKGSGHENKVNSMQSASGVTEDPMQCREGWVKSGDKCLLLTKRIRNFRDARELCEMEHNATLPTISDEHENEALRNITNPPVDSPIWLYLVYNHEYKVARWLDGSRLDYVHWDDGQPSAELSHNINTTSWSRTQISANSTGNEEMECVSFWSDGKWATIIGCSLPLPVVCEKRLPTVTGPNSKPTGLSSPQAKRQPTIPFLLRFGLAPNSEGSGPEIKLMFSASGVTRAPVRCRKGWVRSKDKCLLVTSLKKDFRAARRLCALEHNATLPTVASEDDNEALRNSTTVEGGMVDPIWLYSMHNHEYHATRWWDKSPVEYENWAPGQPSEEPLFAHDMVPQRSGSKEMECVAFRPDGRWTTQLGCAFLLPVVCERKLQPDSRLAIEHIGAVASQSGRLQEAPARSTLLGLSLALAVFRAHISRIFTIVL